MTDTKRAGLLVQFREEVDTQVLLLQQGLVALEQRPANTELLNEVFRAAHTIKGAARMLGFADISRVTHELEEVLATMRRGELTLTPAISDVLFEASDIVKDLAQAQSGGHSPTPVPPDTVETVVARLQEIVAPPASGAARSIGAVAEAPPSGNGRVAPAEIAPAPAEVRPAGAIQSFLEDTMRVQVQKLDTLMNLSGEMVISKMQNEAVSDQLRQVLELFRLRQRSLAALQESVARTWNMLSQQDMDAHLARLRDLDGEVDQLLTAALQDFQDYAAHINNVADELEDTVLSVRMLTVESLFSAFPRAVRDMAREGGKEIDLVITGGETELDKKVLESLYDPLVHLLRNAVDHGIEPPDERIAAGKPPRGRITIRAFQQGGQVGIEVSDDGAGLDPALLRRVAAQKGFLPPADAERLTDDEVLQLIYQPGFSTARLITDVSGRGVGMDIVRTTLVERLNGSVAVQSRPGQGTTISLKVPLTLATTQGLLVRVGLQVYVLPSHTVGTMQYISAEEVQTVEGHEVVRLHDRTLPLLRLESLLDLDRVGPLHYRLNGTDTSLSSGISLENTLPGIIVGDSDRQFCLLVDELLDERVIVVKSLGPLFHNINSQIGATLLGNGQVVIILDVPNLLAEARARLGRGQLAPAWQTAPAPHVHRILVVDDSITTRELEKSILENAGYEVEIAMDGREALVRLERAPAYFDMAIIDIEMPRMDGLELTERIKQHADERLRRLPVIIVSSLSSDAYKRRGVEVGAQAYITKSQFEQSRLLETIELLIH